MKSFVPVLIVLFVIAILLRIDFYFSILYLLFALFVLSRIWIQHTESALQVQRRFTERAFLGDQVAVEVLIENRSELPIPWVELSEILPVQLRTPPFYRQVLSLGRREQRHLHYTLLCRRRGYYPIGPMHIQTGDLFGLQRNRRATIAPDYLIVYPRVVPIQRLGLPTHSPLVALPARSPLFEDPARVMGVRGYQRGDSPRRIHWTATASTGRILVKQYQPAVARETLICLDMNEENYERGVRFTATELAVVVAASLANHIIVGEGLPAGLAADGWDPLPATPMRGSLTPRAERHHLMLLLETLARVQTITGESTFPELVRRESTTLTWGATITVITGSESAALFDTLLYLRRAGFSVALILVQSAAPSQTLKQRSGLLHIPLYRVWAEEDLVALPEIQPS